MCHYALLVAFQPLNLRSVITRNPTISTVPHPSSFPNIVITSATRLGAVVDSDMTLVAIPRAIASVPMAAIQDPTRRLDKRQSAYRLGSLAVGGIFDVAVARSELGLIRVDAVSVNGVDARLARVEIGLEARALAVITIGVGGCDGQAGNDKEEELHSVDLESLVESMEAVGERAKWLLERREKGKCCG